CEYIPRKAGRPRKKKACLEYKLLRTKCTDKEYECYNCNQKNCTEQFVSQISKEQVE
ncbi:21168_t:CDS:1, partial [Racocetra persica]